MASKNTGPWQPTPSSPREEWCAAGSTEHILNTDGEIPRDWVTTCLARVQVIRDELKEAYVGLDDDPFGHPVDWLLAALIARENPLLLGPPGVAKTELVMRLFELLDLQTPEAPDDTTLQLEDGVTAREVRDAWRAREAEERKRQKYFHYLLGRFTQPEELFGPVDISLLQQGILARANFGLLTGPGVRAAFLDEIFKASSSILNTLLTLTQERCFFNWGGMQPADLHVLVGASNEAPGAVASGGVGSAQEDFSALYAFIDRFAVRLLVPNVSGTSDTPDGESHLEQAFVRATEREALRFRTGSGFMPKAKPVACINDILLLGRACLQQLSPNNQDQGQLFRDAQLTEFRASFIRLASTLQAENTNPRMGDLRWTISPRKLKALYKIALAHALLRSEKGKAAPSPERPDLAVFAHIWDSPIARNDLRAKVKHAM